MQAIIEKNLRATVARAELYQPALSVEELLRKSSLQQVIKLGSNENPFGSNPKVIEKITQSWTQISRYGDPTAANIRNALADYYGISANQFIMGNGSAEVLSLLAHAFVEINDEVLVPAYSFCLFNIFTQLLGGVCKSVELTDWFVDVNKLLSAVTEKTKIIYLAVPNNPTGTWLTHAELETIMQGIPQHILVISDEAYFEYNQRSDKPDTIALIKNYPNLIATRTFSKAFGLAGLRIGYGIAHPEVISALNRVRLSFNVNNIASLAALASLEDTEFMQTSIEHNAIEMARFQAYFDEWGIDYLPSVTNFLTIDLKIPAQTFYEALLAKGIITRTLYNYQLPHFLSVTLGKTEENNQFLKEFKILIDEYKIGKKRHATSTS